MIRGSLATCLMMMICPCVTCGLGVAWLGFYLRNVLCGSPGEVTPPFSASFGSSECEGGVVEAVEQEGRLCDGVEAVEQEDSLCDGVEAVEQEDRLCDGVEAVEQANSLCGGVEAVEQEDRLCDGVEAVELLGQIV